ncbi:MAG: response regulator [Candidatus Thorarchaeota archaeon]|jgi:CheY-like chemotaxis protein
MTGDKILLIEDNRDDVLLTKRALEKANITNEVDAVKDGMEALEYLRGEGKFNDRDTSMHPVVILLDLKMPRMGGLEFLKTIRSSEEFKFLPTVVLTSSREEQDIIESYNLGANSYIQKPVDFDQFVKAVQTLGLYWLVLNVSPDGGSTA